MGDLSFFKVAERTSPRLPAPETDMVCLDLDNKAGTLFSMNETYCFPSASAFRVETRSESLRG